MQSVARVKKNKIECSNLLLLLDKHYATRPTRNGCSMSRSVVYFCGLFAMWHVQRCYGKQRTYLCVHRSSRAITAIACLAETLIAKMPPGGLLLSYRLLSGVEWSGRSRSPLPPPVTYLGKLIYAVGVSTGVSQGRSRPLVAIFTPRFGTDRMCHN